MSNELLFHWHKHGDRYTFTGSAEIHGDPDQYNGQLADIARWCKAQKLKPEDFKVVAFRTTRSEKVEHFDASQRPPAFSGSTMFHPTRLRVEVELPEHLGAMFTMAFRCTDARSPRQA